MWDPRTTGPSRNQLSIVCIVHYIHTILYVKHLYSINLSTKQHTNNNNNIYTCTVDYIVNKIHIEFTALFIQTAALRTGGQ